MINVVCDICGRHAGQINEDGYQTIHVAVPDTLIGRGELHICRARDGGDVGCMGFVNAGIKHARELAADHHGQAHPVR